jgi:hypothetical protein
MTRRSTETDPRAEALAARLREALDDAAIADTARACLARCRARGLVSDWDEDACPKPLHFATLAAATAATIPAGGTVEVGVYRGGTAGILLMTGAPDRYHVSIDPFGLPEQSYTNPTLPYGDAGAARATLRALGELAEEQAVTLCHYWMASTRFIEADLLTHPGGFRFVHLDGPHDRDTVAAELRYFRSRIAGPCVFVLDDHDALNPGVAEAVKAAGAGLEPLFHRHYDTRYGRCGFSAWLHWAAEAA